MTLIEKEKNSSKMREYGKVEQKKSEKMKKYGKLRKE